MVDASEWRAADKPQFASSRTPDLLSRKALISRVGSLPELEHIIVKVRSTETVNEQAWTTNVEHIANIGFDLTPTWRDYSELEMRLDSLGFDVMPLEKCCVWIPPARGISKKDFELSPVETDSPGLRVPYYRIQDILPNGRLDQPSVHLKLEWEESHQESMLQKGDILLTNSTAIGKVTIVGKAQAGGIAGRGLIVLRVKKDLLTPEYLFSYLRDEEVQKWFHDHARGGGSRQLSANVIKMLPIAVPPQQFQLKFDFNPGKEEAEREILADSDALPYLASLLDSEEDQDPSDTQAWQGISRRINSWLERCQAKTKEHLAKISASLNRDGALETVHQLVLRLVAISSPIKRCKVCKQPYFLDFEFSDEIGHQGSSWNEGMGTTCLICWSDAGGRNNDETTEALSKRDSRVPWTLACLEVMLSLRHIDEHRRNKSICLNILQLADKKLHDLKEQIKVQLSTEEPALELVRDFQSFIAEIVDFLLEPVDMEVSVVQATLQTIDEHSHAYGTVEVLIKQKAPFPVLDVTFYYHLHGKLFPHEHRHIYSTEIVELGSLATNAALETTVTCDVKMKDYQDDTPVPLVLWWQGKRLNGESFEGEVYLPVEHSAFAAPDHQEKELQPLGATPYLTGGEIPQDRKDLFKGRDDLLEKIRRQVEQSGNVILLEGNRRSGKSSILRQLAGKDEIPGWLAVRFSIQEVEGSQDGRPGVPTVNLFRSMAYRIARASKQVKGASILPEGDASPAGGRKAIKDHVNAGIREETPFQDFCEYIEVVLEALAEEDLGLLLLIDEFDVLQEGMEAGVTSPQVPSNIRFLLQTYPRFSAILAGARRLKRMREEYWSPLFGLGQNFSVGKIHDEAAARLIQDPAPGLAYSKEAVELVIEQTAGHPYLIQNLSNVIFEGAVETKQRSINVDQVQQAIQSLVDDFGHFEWVWGEQSDGGSLEEGQVQCARQRFLLALIFENQTGPDPMSLNNIIDKVYEVGLEASERVLISDLEFLRDLELIEKHGDGKSSHYTLAIPLFGSWIDHRCDFDALYRRAQMESEDIDPGEADHE